MLVFDNLHILNVINKHAKIKRKKRKTKEFRFFIIQEKGKSQKMSNFAQKSKAMMTLKYDVVVIGGGHAGCEAACASASRGLRLGMTVLFLAMIGKTSIYYTIMALWRHH